VLLGGTMITSFPSLQQVPEGVSMPLAVFPYPYRRFLYWELLHHDVVPADSTLEEVSVTFFGTDTIIAHLESEEYGYYVPNSFTPNGDGINDVWFPLGNAIDLETYQLSIFDRWGEEIYLSTDPSEGWDGASVQDGVYVYRANVIDAISGDKHELYGHVTLFR
jgi:gliding motility-associated-like protein